MKLNSARLTTRMRRPWADQRGFTLVELMVVVLIVGIFATTAAVTVTNQMRDRRTSNAAHRIAQIYRTARMRAIGRGAAVNVRYNAGAIQVLEAVVGPAPGGTRCELAPAASCSTPAARWTTPTLFREIDRFQQTGGVHDYLQMTFTAPGATDKAEICFTPGGSTYHRWDVGTGVFMPLTAVPTFTFQSLKNGAQYGPTRYVYVLPNGVARVGT